MRRRKRSKKTQQTLVRHAGLRAAQRYGIFFGNEENDEAVRQIQRGEATLIEKQSIRVSVWKVVIHDKEIPVCYDANRKSIITCLPPECLDWHGYDKGYLD